MSVYMSYVVILLSGFITTCHRRIRSQYQRLSQEIQAMGLMHKRKLQVLIYQQCILVAMETMLRPITGIEEFAGHWYETDFQKKSELETDKRSTIKHHTCTD